MAANVNEEILTHDVAMMEAHVKRMQGVTFAELQRVLAQDMPTFGNQDILAPENLVFWIGLSDRFTAAFTKLVHEGRVHMWPTTAWAYLVEGACLRLPIAQHPGERDYKTLHWVPIVIHPGPYRHADGTVVDVYGAACQSGK